MASTGTSGSYDSLLKDNYTEDEIARQVYKDHPTLEKITKETDHSGRQFIQPIIHATPSGFGPTLSHAQESSNQASGQGNLRAKDWNCAWGEFSAAVSVGHKVLQQSRNDEGAFFRNQILEHDLLFQRWGDIHSYLIFSDAGLALNQGSTITISSGVCTCGNANDIVNFYEGMILQASATDGTSSGTLLGSGSKGYVYNINHNAGTFTVATSEANAAAGTAGTPTGWTGSMYMFRSGEYGGATSANRVILGLGAWVPSSDPSSTSFEGVDRTANIAALSGVRVPSADLTSRGLESRVKQLVVRMVSRAGSPKPDAISLNDEDWQQLADNLDTRGSRMISEAKGKFNYETITLRTSRGPVEVYGDRFNPPGTFRAHNFKYIKLASLGPYPGIMNQDGFKMLRNAGSNDLEMRLYGYGAFCVSWPGAQGYGVVPAAS